ncbi:MAG: serine acetyltransferase [Ruminococcus sp.]|nr:serine acetyltransferase [Ruminococcus sp.]
MIKSKEDLKRFIYNDNGYLNKSYDKKSFLFMRLVHDTQHYICKYLEMLRKQEYYINTRGSNKLKALLALYYERKKHNLGNKLGFYIGPNCCDEGLTLFHHGSVIINPNAKIGKNCLFHGNNCVGNNGKTEACPVIGDNVDIGFGAIIIGDIKIADNVKIGANAVVTKSCLEKGATLVGIPAHKLS